MLTDKGNGDVIVKLFDEEGNDMSITVKKKNWKISILNKNF